MVRRLDPLAVVAWTEKTYLVPLPSPAMVHVSLAVVHVRLPGLEVTVYLVIGKPPLEVGAFHVITAS